jgi:hypothetical protein
VFAAVTIGPKLADFRAATGADRDEPYAARVVSFLAASGWARIGEVDLLIGIEQRATQYRAAPCPGEVLVAVLPPSGEADALITERLGRGEHLFFVVGGRVSNEAPSFLFLKDKLGQISEAIDLPLFQRSPYLAVVGPGDCHLEVAVPWSSL